MGRKLIPDALRRTPLTLSIPADVKAYLDKMAAKTGLPRSRIIEGCVRESMRKGQATLTDIRHHWKCSSCGCSWKQKDPSKDFVFCPSCTRSMPQEEYLGAFEEVEE